MPTPEPRPVLARIIAAHKGVGPGRANLSDPLNTGLTRAIRRAATPFGGLLPRIDDVEVSINATLTNGVEALPDHGLLAAIEDEEGRRGFVALGHGLVDALIEVQATGAVEEGDLPQRPVTRIDEALCRDFLDLLLGAFAKETAGEAARDWPDRMSYGSRVSDRSQLNLLLPENGYHLLKARLTAAGRKSGALVLLLPVDPALARRRMAAVPVASDAAPVDWSARMLRALGAAPMTLNAILVRHVMPLGRVEALAPGDLIGFQPADLASVSLEGEGDHVFARGALGQLGGQRALRFAGAAAGAKPPVAQPGPPGPVQPGAGTGGGGLMAQAGPGAMAPLPVAGFDPDAPMGGFDPDAPMGGFDPDAPMGGFDPDAPMGGFDPDAPMG